MHEKFGYPHQYTGMLQARHCEIGSVVIVLSSYFDNCVGDKCEYLLSVRYWRRGSPTWRPSGGSILSLVINHKWKFSEKITILFIKKILMPSWFRRRWVIYIYSLQSQISKFQTRFNDKYLKYFLWNCYQMNGTIPHWSFVNIGSGNGLVPSGNKPLPEPVLT